MDTYSILALAIGAFVYGLVMWDVLKTTLSMHGGGPLTEWVMRQANRLIAAPPAKFGVNTNADSGAQLFARYSGLLLTSLLFFVWFTGLTLALTLALGSEADSITESNGLGRITWLERLYFVAASVTTAGFGDFVPHGNVWRMYTILTAASGLIVTSLGISYVINLVGAVTAQRQLARSIASLGTHPGHALAAFWNGEDFKAYGGTLQSIAEAIFGHVQRHLAYPMCHYVRAGDNRDCLPAALAVFDETLTVILYEVPTEYQPNLGNLLLARRAVSAYLERLRVIYVDAADEPPAWPDASFLTTHWGITPARRARGLSAEARGALTRRRALLRAAVQSQGLTWDKLVDSLRASADEPLDADLLEISGATPLASAANDSSVP